MKRILLIGLVFLLGAWTVASAQDVRWDPQFATALNGQVNAVLVQGTDVYVGGSFTTAGGTSANNIAKWNGTSWEALGLGVNGAVYALAWYNDSLWVGGSFTEAGGPAQYATSIAKWSGTTWYPVGGTNGPAVRAMLTTSSGLYIGGAFSSIGTLGSVNYLAKYEGAGVWSDVGGGTNGVVMTLAQFSPDTLFVGGNFTSAASGLPLMYSAGKWTGSAWLPMGGVEFGTTVRASAAIGDTLYVGGDFTNVSDGSVAALRIARYVKGVWSTVGSGFDASVHSLHLSGSVLYAGGSFLNSGGTAINRIAEWNGSTWSGLGSGTDGTVYALGTMGYNVYAGGSFLNAGLKSSAYFGSYLGTLGAPTLINPPAAAAVTVTPSLDWSDVIGADSYHLQIASNASFTTIVRNITGIATSTYVPAALSNSTTYYWRVATVNVAGESPWSSSRDFTTSIIAPTLTSPPAGAATSTYHGSNILSRSDGDRCGLHVAGR